MASFRAFLPAAHGGSGLPVAALKAAATSGATFVVVCPAGARAKAVVAALQAATKGAGLVLSTRVVTCAAKRSGGVEDGQGDERTGEDAEEVKDGFVFGAGDNHAGEEANKDDAKTFVFGAGEEANKDDAKAFVLGTGEEANKDDTKVFVFGGSEEVSKEDAKAFFVGADEDRTGNAIKPTNDDVIYGPGEMTMTELVLRFHKETALLLKQAKQDFPMGNDDETSLASLMATCDDIGEQIQKAVRLLDSPEGRPIVQKLIALHLRIVSCAGGVHIRKRGSSMPEMWSGDRLPCKEELAGTLMELLLYSMLMANAALGRFIGAVTWDFTGYE